jgi:neutral amino acid transport system ATP-binding protein
VSESRSPSDPILVVDHVVRRFGGVVAVSVEHLEIRRNAITALIGPNGAGKTTFFNVLTGFDRADGGRWVFDGLDVARRPAYRIARQGMVRTFQLTKALAQLTVLENMMLGAQDQAGENMGRALLRFPWRAQEHDVRERARSLLADFGLAAKERDAATTLSGGQRKLLEMARALMTNPSLLLLDEPMAGVNPALVQSLLDHIRRLRDEGRTVLFVEHDMDVVMTISDHVVCMAEGCVIAEGTPQEIASNQDVIDAYLGTRHALQA